MDHKFTPTQINPDKCIHCKWPFIAHTDTAECESCGNIGECEISGNMLLCKPCFKAERDAVINYQKPELQEQRYNEYQIRLNEAREIDAAITVRTDIFNATTKPILDLKEAIDNNPEIPADKRRFALAEEVVTRITTFKKAAFDKQNELVELNSQLRSYQQFLNGLQSQLRQDEREKLKIQDINYQPKPVSKPTVKKVTTKKFDKVALRNAAALLTRELGMPVPEYMVHTIVTNKQLTIDEAIAHIRKTVLEGRSEKPATNNA